MPNRDNAVVLDMVLDRLARHARYPDIELIVVDDGSTDGSLEILRRWGASQRFAEFRLIEHEHGPGGVVDALNVGLQAATGDLVVQLDADASIETPGWVELMAAFFLTDARVGVVTSKVVRDSGEPEALGINVVGPEGYYNRWSEVPEAAREQIAEVDGGDGVCMMYRRAAALEVGGYDVGFAPVWLDDVDLTISMRRIGLKVFCLPQVLAVHHVGMRERPDDRPVAPGPMRTAATKIRRGVGAALPAYAKNRLIQAFGWDIGPRSYRRRLAQHYAYWRKKWGWDLRSPDMEVIHQLWGQTEICWRTKPEMRRAGEMIIAAFETAYRRGGGLNSAQDVMADPGRPP